MFNYLLAKKTGGQFILRIEDTDQVCAAAAVLAEQADAVVKRKEPFLARRVIFSRVCDGPEFSGMKVCIYIYLYIYMDRYMPSSPPQTSALAHCDPPQVPISAVNMAHTDR